MCWAEPSSLTRDEAGDKEGYMDSGNGDRDKSITDRSAHIPGVPRGEDESGRRHNGRRIVQCTRKSRDATGINADKRAPIDPRMPNLPPA